MIFKKDEADEITAGRCGSGDAAQAGVSGTPTEGKGDADGGER